MSKETLDADVIVVGAGNAACSAAMAARDAGARVIMLEAAPNEERGGNSTYTAGATRLVYNGVDDVTSLVDLSEAELANMDFGTYTEEQYFDDMYRMTRYRTDPELCDILVNNSPTTWHWLRKHGVKFQTQPRAARPSRSTASSSSGAACASRPGAVATA